MVAEYAAPSELQPVVLDLLSRRDPILGMFSRLTANLFEVWFVTKPLTPAQERDFYRIAGQLRERFPGMGVELHIEHAGMYEGGNPFDAVPPDAQRYQPNA